MLFLHLTITVQIAVTGLSLDLTLLAIMTLGDDYMPAIQGLQLSNKLRPGLWDLYLDMRSRPEWQGQSLVLRQCDCSLPSGEGSSSSPGTCEGGLTVEINATMVATLLQRYLDQRFLQKPLENTILSFVGSWDEGPKEASVAQVSKNWTWYC
jgi:hypothetical protein